MLPERLIQRAVEEATRGVSAVRDHLVNKFNVQGKRFQFCSYVSKNNESILNAEYSFVNEHGSYS